MEMLVGTQRLARLYPLMVAALVVLVLVAPLEAAAAVNCPLAQLALLLEQPFREDRMFW